MSLIETGAPATPSPPPDGVTVSVCVSCRGPEGSPPEALPGRDLVAALRAHREAGSFRIRAVQCLSVCKRPCTVSLTGPDRYTYLFGDLDPETAADTLADAVRQYRAQEHGYMLWRERPEALRRGILARIPPPGWDDPDGRHPR